MPKAKGKKQFKPPSAAVRRPSRTARVTDNISESGSFHGFESNTQPSEDDQQEQLPPSVIQQMQQMIEAGISKALAPMLAQATATTSTQQHPNSDTGKTPPLTPHKPSEVVDLDLSVESDEGSESEMETEEPRRAVRQSFGLKVGQTISKYWKKRILAGKYIEMYDLLPESKKNTNEDEIVLKNQTVVVGSLRWSIRPEKSLSPWSNGTRLSVPILRYIPQTQERLLRHIPSWWTCSPTKGT